MKIINLSNLMTNKLFDEEPFALKYLKYDVKEFYDASHGQYTINPLPSHTYADILNKKGLKLYESVCSAAQKNDAFKNVINNPQRVQHPSGAWIADETSPFYTGDLKATLNSFNNNIITGTINTEQYTGPISTSVCLFITPEWCYTLSGSFYQLK